MLCDQRSDDYRAGGSVEESSTSRDSIRTVLIATRGGCHFDRKVDAD